RGVEDRQSFELGEAVHREPAVLRARSEQDRARGDLPVLLEPHEMPAVPRLERQRTVRRRPAGIELARLRHRAAPQLDAGEPGRKAEVVLDPSRRSRLAAERGALYGKCVEPFGGAVDRGCKARRAGTDDQKVDLFTWRELEPDPERA